MIESVNVIGSRPRRLGGRRAPRGARRRAARATTPSSSLLCVPGHGRSRTWPRGSIPGPAGSRTSAARRRSSALDPHERRFSLHPLQTFTRARGPEQLDGAWAAVTAETDEARERRLLSSPRTLGLRAVRARRRATGRSTTPVPRSPRTTSSRCTAAASALLAAAGAPPEALVPLMRADDRERLRADRPDRARRLGDGRRAPARRSARAARPRAALRRARRGDRRR